MRCPGITALARGLGCNLLLQHRPSHLKICMALAERVLPDVLQSMYNMCVSAAVHASWIVFWCSMTHLCHCSRCLQVVELQEELLEEEGWQAEEVQERCNELRTLLQARVEAGDLLDDTSRSRTHREDLNWALQNSTSNQGGRSGGGGRGNGEVPGGLNRDAQDKGRRSPSQERYPTDSDRERDKADKNRGTDSRYGRRRTADEHGRAPRRRGSDRADDGERGARYRRDGAAEERGSDGRYSRPQRDEGDRYRRDGDRSREKGRDRDTDRGHRSWEDDRDSKRVRRQ